MLAKTLVLRYTLNNSSFCRLTVDSEVESSTGCRFHLILGYAVDWPLQVCMKNLTNDELAAVLHHMLPIHHHGSWIVQPAVREKRPFGRAGEDLVSHLGDLLNMFKTFKTLNGVQPHLGYFLGKKNFTDQNSDSYNTAIWLSHSHSCPMLSDSFFIFLVWLKRVKNLTAVSVSHSF